VKAKLLGFLALAVAALLIVALDRSDGPVAADTPHTGLNFHIGLADDGGIDRCSTSGTQGNSCYVNEVGPLTLSVYLDNAGLLGYRGYQIAVPYDLDATFLNLVLHTWPDCGATVSPSTSSSTFTTYTVTFGCFTSPWNHVSSYTGKIAEMAFLPCDRVITLGEHHTISLVHGVTGTRLIDRDGNPHAEGEGITESLDIICNNPTHTPTPGLACTSQTLGDVDNDFQVDAIDGLFVLQHVVNRSLRCPGNGNVNHSPVNPPCPEDGITSVDGTLILQYVAGLISVFPSTTSC
jgi:hypothetical protein